MKLVKAHIYGFGKWVDYPIDFSSESFIGVFGLNESGKSTIHQFILFMLFGLPPRQRKFYRPKTSGKMGGQLTVFDDNIGTYRIERIDEVDNGKARCFVDQHEYDEHWLTKQLKGLTREIYHGIYSFSTSDLMHITEINDNDLGDILLGIGLTGSSHIQEIERRLDHQSGQLFKPYGKKPHINQQLVKVNQLHTELIEHQQLSTSYRDKQTELSQLRERLTDLQKDLAATTETEFILSQQQQALPLVHQYRQLQKQLQTYPATLSFPENGLERMKQLTENLLPLQSERTIIHKNVNKLKTTLHELKDDLVDEKVLQQLTQIEEQRQKYSENNQQMELLQQSSKEQQWQIEQMLKDLQIELTVEQIAELTLPFHLEQDWLDLKRHHERLIFEKEQVIDEQGAIIEQQSQLEEKQHNLQEQCLNEAAQKELQQKIRDYNSYEHWEEMNRQSTHSVNLWKDKRNKKINQLKFTLFGSVLGGVFSIGFAYLSNEGWLYLFASLLFIFGLGFWLFNHFTLKEMNRFIEQMNERERMVSTVSIAEKNEAEQLLNKQNRLQEQINALQEQLKMLAIQLLQADEKLIVIRQQERRLQAQIAEHRERYPFLHGVEVNYWPELFQSLTKLLRMQRERDQYLAAYRNLEQKQKSIHQVLTELAEQVNISHKEQTGESLFSSFHVFLQDQLQKQQLMQQHEQAYVEAQNQLSELQEKINRYETEMSQLFSLADVDTEEAFHQQAKRYKEKQMLSKELQDLKDQVTSLFPKVIWEKLLHDPISQTEINLHREKSKHKKQELEERVEQVRQQLAELKAEITHLETSDTYSQTMHQYTLAKEQLRKLTIDWAIVKTAKEMLAKTKQQYREKYLTEVLAKTSTIFQYITDGGYQKVYAPDDQHPFQVEARNGMIYQVNELSRGTIDQLYISLRLAISDVMSEQHRLPFIIDDAFLNFDSIRLHRMIDILRNQSHKQQIILLTCRQSIVDQLQGDAKVIQLSPTIHLQS